MAADLLIPGQTFVGRYRIGRRVALGGMGAIFSAEQVATELPVAIKVLYPHVLASVDAIEKFTMEGRIAARLNSDHIVRVFDAGYDDETHLPFLVMELLRGQDLQKLVEAHGPFQAETVTEYVNQVARGLEKAHSYVSREGVREPIVHRDLKPENLFLTHTEDGRPIIKILDFGMAKVLGETSGVSQDIKGTPLFMAYEQASGGLLSPQTDIWALGLTTFYLLTGRNYWKTASTVRPQLASLFGEILTQKLEPPSERARQLDCPWSIAPAYDYWFLRCLDRDPKMRFASALQAASELEQALGYARATARPQVPSGMSRTSAGHDHLGATQPSSDGSMPALAKTMTSGTLEFPVSTPTPQEAARPAPWKWGKGRALAVAAGGTLALAGLARFGLPPPGRPENAAADVPGAAPAQTNAPQPEERPSHPAQEAKSARPEQPASALVHGTPETADTALTAEQSMTSPRPTANNLQVAARGPASPTSTPPASRRNDVRERPTASSRPNDPLAQPPTAELTPGDEGSSSSGSETEPVEVPSPEQASAEASRKAYEVR